MTVAATGPLNARIVLIGEAPGETEEKLGKPFVGQAGRVLDGLLEEAGIRREECYITNVVQDRPAGNNFAQFYTDKHAPTPELQEAYVRLHNEIMAVKPNVIVPLGGEALKAVYGTYGIIDYRGSILDTLYGKAVPTIHPAAILRKWSYRPAVVSDFIRIREQSYFPEVRIEKRTPTVCYTYNAALALLEMVEAMPGVSFDIENESSQITCIGFGTGAHTSFTIPFWFAGSGSLFPIEQEAVLWQKITAIMENPAIRKYAHNAAYDIEFLRRNMGIRTQGLWIDTMLAGHTLYAELPKSLAFYTSLYTDVPYYKYQRKTAHMDTYFRYNGMDCMVTHELAMKLGEELRERGSWQFYEHKVHTLIEPLLAMEEQGVKFDMELCAATKKEYKAEIKTLQESLEAQVGHALNVGSNKQMLAWLYDELKLPKQLNLDKRTGVKRATADNEALETLYKLSKNEAIKTVIAIREKAKLLSTYLEVKLDEDKRIRCGYLVTGTETGRLSSRQTSRGTGTNLQNIPSGVIKRLFIADEGYVFLNADLSQAEARVVAYVAGEERLIKVFEEGGDVHRRNAANIYNKKESEVTDDERQLAKRVVHACNYGMGPRTFAKTAGVAESDARRLLNQYFATYPRIKLWHMQLSSQLRKSRVVTTPLGRKREFFERWGESLLREALAFIPQSTVADVVNAALARMYERKETWFQPLLQIHDAILVQVPVDKVEEGIKLLKECMTLPVEINGKILVIPVDVKRGVNWEDMIKC